MDGASEVVIEKFLGTGLAIYTGQHAGIRSAIEYPVNRREIGQILFVADVPHPDIDPQGAQWLEISFTSFSNQTIDTSDTNTRKVLKKPTGNH
jgi:hypothetical protein